MKSVRKRKVNQTLRNWKDGAANQLRHGGSEIKWVRCGETVDRDIRRSILNTEFETAINYSKKLSSGQPNYINLMFRIYV